MGCLLRVFLFPFYFFVFFCMDLDIDIDLDLELVLDREDFPDLDELVSEKLSVTLNMIL